MTKKIKETKLQTLCPNVYLFKIKNNKLQKIYLEIENILNCAYILKTNMHNTR